MLKTVITNPTNKTRSYSWIRLGLTLAPGESCVVDYNPFANCRNRMQRTLLERDVKFKMVELTFAVEEPCKITTMDKISKIAKVPTKAITKQEETTIIEKEQIKPVLDVVDEKVQEPVVSLETNKEVSDAMENQVTVDVFGDSELTDTETLEVAAPATAKTAKKTPAKSTKKSTKGTAE